MSENLGEIRAFVVAHWGEPPQFHSDSVKRLDWGDMSPAYHEGRLLIGYADRAGVLYAYAEKRWHRMEPEPERPARGGGRNPRRRPRGR